MSTRAEIAILTLDMLLAEREIYRCLVRFARAMDQRDWDALDDIVRADATADLGTGELKGRPAIVALMRSFLDDCGPTQHLLGKVLIEVQADTAQSSCYVSDVQAPATGPRFLYSAGVRCSDPHFHPGGGREPQPEQSHTDWQFGGRSRSPQYLHRVPCRDPFPGHQSPVEEPVRGAPGEDRVAPGDLLE